MAGSFIDTNVLLYLASDDRVKADVAERLLLEGGVTGVQVLNEFVNVARRKMLLSWPEIREFLDAFRQMLAVRDLTMADHERGLFLAERHGFSTFDAMIVGAALEAGCERLWSEDMQSGMLVDGRLLIANPFAA